MEIMKNKRKRGFVNETHRTIFMLVLLAALLPTFIVAVLLYYLIFKITAEHIGMPDVIAYHIVPAAKQVLSILFIATIPVILTILFFAHKIAHQIIGPFDRIIRELDEHVEGAGEGYITIRENDKFSPLVERINKLLHRKKKEE